MTYIVVFSDGIGKPPFWACKLKKGFKHCYVLKDYGFCLEKVECCLNHIDTDLYLPELITINPTDTWVKINIDNNLLKSFGILHLLSCVSVTKKFIGIYDYTIQTPYQLYKYLINIGGKQYNNGIDIWG